MYLYVLYKIIFYMLFIKMYLFTTNVCFVDGYDLINLLCYKQRGFATSPLKGGWNFFVW